MHSPSHPAPRPHLLLPSSHPDPHLFLHVPVGQALQQRGRRNGREHGPQGLRQRLQQPGQERARGDGGALREAREGTLSFGGPRERVS